MSGQNQMEENVKGLFQVLPKELLADCLTFVSVLICSLFFFFLQVFFIVPDSTKFQFKFQTGIFAKIWAICFYIKYFLCTTISVYNGYVQ